MRRQRLLGLSLPVAVARAAQAGGVLLLVLVVFVLLWYPGYRAERRAERHAEEVQAALAEDDRFRGVDVVARDGKITLVCPARFYNTGYNPSETLGIIASLRRVVSATDPPVVVNYRQEVEDVLGALGVPSSPGPMDRYEDEIDELQQGLREATWLYALGIYYDGIDPDATGEALRAALHELVSVSETLTYAQLWEALAYTDSDPEQAGHVLLFYSGWSRPADAHGGAPGEWNREHVWAKSRGGFGNDPPVGTDLHHIRPTDVSVNQARGNRAFDDGGEPYVDADGETGCRFDGDSWEPRDEVKGDVARMLFYMAVRYEDAALDLELVGEAPEQADGRPVHGVLPTLLRWHAEDPPDDLERLRHARVYLLQGNRNPFIDHPEWAAVIWGE